MYIVVTLTVPPQYLVDTCAMGTWSELEDDATWFRSREDAIAAVLAGDLLALAELETTWDVIPIVTPP